VRHRIERTVDTTWALDHYSSPTLRSVFLPAALCRMTGSESSLFAHARAKTKRPTLTSIKLFISYVSLVPRPLTQSLSTFLPRQARRFIKIRADPISCTPQPIREILRAKRPEAD